MRLEPYSAADFELTVALESDPAVMKDLGGAVPPDTIRLLHAKRLAATGTADAYYTVVLDDTTGAVGVGGIWQTPWAGGVVYEVGLLLRSGYHQQGLGLRALRMLIDRGRADLGYSQIHGFVSVTNDASNALCRALGFTLVEVCDADYVGRALWCNHWVLDLRHELASNEPASDEPARDEPASDEPGRD